MLSLIPLYFMLAGFILQPAREIFSGVVNIIREPDILITDYFVVGGVGAAFMNAGIVTLLCIGVIYLLGEQFSGHTVTSTCLMFGFSLFGKNLLNIWFIMFGVWLYECYHRQERGRYIYVALYGTSLSPIITEMMTLTGVPFAARLTISAFTAMIIGFVLPPLATHVHYAHKGYSLYNVGFAGGIIATVIVSVFKSFGLQLQSRLLWSTGNNRRFAIMLGILFSGMIILGRMGDPQVWARYKKLLSRKGVGGTDYVEEIGEWATLVNMGVNGILVTAFLLVVGADLNGPTIGSIFTVVGFSATGKHARNILPVMFGVWLASLMKIWSITDPSATLALLLSTTLAPIAGEFGVIAGIIAGFLHSSVALNVGIVYGGMNLYNNGFAGGIVAIFLVPVIQALRDRKARAKGRISL